MKKENTKRPYMLETKAGAHAWCTCGDSTKEPFCDSKGHIGTVFKPYVHKIKEDGKIAWCGCKLTYDAPFCDGSHKNYK